MRNYTNRFLLVLHYNNELEEDTTISLPIDFFEIISQLTTNGKSVNELIAQFNSESNIETFFYLTDLPSITNVTIKRVARVDPENPTEEIPITSVVEYTSSFWNKISRVRILTGADNDITEYQMVITKI